MLRHLAESHLAESHLAERYVAESRLAESHLAIAVMPWSFGWKSFGCMSFGQKSFGWKLVLFWPIVSRRNDSKQSIFAKFNYLDHDFESGTWSLLLSSDILAMKIPFQAFEIQNLKFEGYALFIFYEILNTNIQKEMPGSPQNSNPCSFYHLSYHHCPFGLKRVTMICKPPKFAYTFPSYSIAQISLW